ncbi:hypothetical protein Q4485_00375 [Granulosicoccaceae sp. 1_MG-2023]|nr:hypothetical protein [Granulosicoccaceae sp. 1_MG-2023]
MFKSKTLVVLPLLGLMAASAYAQSGQRPQGAPQEAIEACADKAENDACQFTGPRDEEISGVCMSSPQGDEGLACAPEGGMPQGPARN